MGVCVYEGAAGTCKPLEMCAYKIVKMLTPLSNNLYTCKIKKKKRNTERLSSTCFKAFLLCFCEGEMSLLAGTEGDEHRGCGDDGCDCSLEGTMKYKSTKTDVTKYTS